MQSFTRFAGQVLSKAPDEARMQLILRSLCVLPDELTWFRETLESRGVTIVGAEEQAALVKYRKAMEEWGAQLPWEEAVLVYFAIEHVYNVAWSSCATAPEPYRSWAVRWGSPEFTEFVGDLEAEAEAALESTGSRGRLRALELFKSVLRLEDGFWSMAFNGKHNNSSKGK